jgi:hypothetical protein
MLISSDGVARLVANERCWYWWIGPSGRSSVGENASGVWAPRKTVKKLMSHFS